MADKYPEYPVNEYLPHQQRVFSEAAELRDRVDKLKKFITGPTNFLELPTMDQALLLAQVGAMNQYLDLLELRISRFKK